MTIAVWGVCLCIMWLLLQIFCFASFKIPSDSMEPTLKDGDCILVNKLVQGARLFDVFAALRHEDIRIWRVPGLGNLKRNDVIVFNFPYDGARWDSIRFDVMEYYVKRCIALPGDTLEIRNGYYQIKGYDGKLGNKKAQRFLSELQRPEDLGIVTGTYPNNSEFGWTIREFGPLLIPKEGKLLSMNRRNAILYKPLIDWEQKKKIVLRNDTVCLGDSVIYNYRFQKNYYFVSGDCMENSRDSRYWGLLPEEYIVGKVTRIWNSKNRHTGKIRWDRVMKRVE